MQHRCPPTPEWNIEVPLWLRKPQRISVTLPEATFEVLLERSNREGRSISNLAAFLLERTIHLNQTQDQDLLPSSGSSGLEF